MMSLRLSRMLTFGKILQYKAKSNIYTITNSNIKVNVKAVNYTVNPKYSLFTSSCKMAKDSIATYEEIVDLKNHPDIMLIDVRDPNELQETGKIPTSINIPLGTLTDVLKNTSEEEFAVQFGRPKPTYDTEVIFHCKMGGRAGKAMENAKQLGYANARNYMGSWTEWASKNQ